MLIKFLLFLFYFIGVIQCGHLQNGIIFRSIQCQAIDKEFFAIITCGFKINKNNNIEELEAVVRPLKGPITNCLFQLEFDIKTFAVPLKFNGTYDACKFMEQRNRVRFLKRIYDVFIHYTNLNHTCPFDHDLYFKSSKEICSAIDLPWPNGTYKYLARWIVDKKVRLRVDGIIEFYKKSSKGNKSEGMNCTEIYHLTQKQLKIV